MDQYWNVLAHASEDPNVYGTVANLGPPHHPSLQDIHMGAQAGHYQYYR